MFLACQYAQLCTAVFRVIKQNSVPRGLRLTFQVTLLCLSSSMNKITGYLRQRRIDRAEERLERFQEAYRDEPWGKMTLEELDNIPSTLPGKPEDKMETAVRMLRLADVYWARYKQHYGSEGENRGQELHQRCYELLCENLGQWSWETQECLKELCRWDIGSSERRIIVDRTLAKVKTLGNSGFYASGLHCDVPFYLILCCLRNNDYSDRVKALLQLYRAHKVKKSTLFYPVLKLLFALHLARQEWNEAEALVAKYPALTTAVRMPQWDKAQIYAYRGELQIERGQLVDGEATLQKGIEPQWEQHDFKVYISCCEQLVNLYLQQERWNDAESLGIHLIEAKESRISHTLAIFDRWNLATKKAPRVIKMNRWRTLNMESDYWIGIDIKIDQDVYFLHELYNNKRQLAIAYVKLKRYNEAQQLLEELMENKMHEENPILLASKALLVGLFTELGKFDEAEKRQEEIIAAKSSSFGYDSEKLIPDLERLADIYQKNNHLGKRHQVKIRLLRYR
ncbi:hypothetical protein CPB83DRAFT_860939 [Crepidotus variabilis]|uniref:Uncharacterized protein n=1 Tax=Crepidotus variabilis TaxID=179855 RepID=A0A9P6E8P2_9AGAR|nr:hypothetical protein CPB83DRAFT_860939 [Crepidotus variabilis]